MKLVSVERAPGGNYVVTTYNEPSWVAAMFGAQAERRRFYGSDGVWHAVPSYRRCSRADEKRLDALMVEAAATGLLCGSASGCREPAERTCAKCDRRFCGPHFRVGVCGECWERRGE